MFPFIVTKGFLTSVTKIIKNPLFYQNTIALIVQSAENKINIIIKGVLAKRGNTSATAIGLRTKVPNNQS